MGLLPALGEVGGSLVVFNRDGGGDVLLEQGRDSSTGGELKPDVLPYLLGQNVDQGVVHPSGGEGVGDVLVDDG